MRHINHIIIHHTATPTTATVESIRRYHTAVKGWIDIGYHYLIDGEGRVRLGRPECQVGAHCKGHNADSVGVAVIGNFEKNGISSIQESALLVLLDDLIYRYPAVDVKFHGEMPGAHTLCPGRYLRQWVESWRYDPEAMEIPVDVAPGKDTQS